MIYLVMTLTALSVSLMVVAVSQLSSHEGRLIKRQLAALRIPTPTHVRLAERRARQKRRRRMHVLMEAIGTKLAVGRAAKDGIRQWLLQAGFRHPGGVHVFLSLRLISALLGGTSAVALMTLFGADPLLWIMVITLSALTGWMLPFLIVKTKARRRQREIQKSIPDMLDLLVVCVEAGLGLNQALFRVAQEIDRVTPDLAEELAIANLEIRAGTARTEALKGLGERTGLEDMKSLTSMLVQTDRFGTSISQALRVHADTLRTKRKQRAEERAAKTSIKMIFPLALFVFPAILVVILGPALFIFKDLMGTF